MSSINIHVPGAPQGKGRARAFAKPGGRIGHYTPEKTRTYEGMIRTLAMEAMTGKQIIEGPVEMTLWIVMPIPRSWPQWKKDAASGGLIAPTTKPDSDNVAKAVKDALNGVVWVDDCQVVSLAIRKMYHSSGRAVGVHLSAHQIAAMPAQHKHKPQVAA